jgi:hypothetical protein
LCNIASVFAYSKEFTLREKIPLFFLPAIFLVLLYKAPSGLVLYWTCNNIFSLIKNVVQKNNIPQKCLFAVLALFSVMISVYVIFIHAGALHKRIIISFAALVTAAFFIAKIFRVKFSVNPLAAFRFQNINSRNIKQVYVLACAALSMLAGFVLPSGIIASSAAEFSIPQLGLNPLPLVGITVLEALGFFAWFMLIFALTGEKSPQGNSIYPA